MPALYFWALQASFVDRGRDGGAGHLGLQWHPDHPGSTAVNWGGYDATGRELSGSAATLPSALDNPNTRDLAWSPGVAYRLGIRRVTEAESAAGGVPDGLVAWRGEVTDLSSGITTVVRDLWAAGSGLAAPVVWSEVFAACDDPAVSGALARPAPDRPGTGSSTPVRSGVGQLPGAGRRRLRHHRRVRRRGRACAR